MEFTIFHPTYEVPQADYDECQLMLIEHMANGSASKGFQTSHQTHPLQLFQDTTCPLQIANQGKGNHE